MSAADPDLTRAQGALESLLQQMLSPAALLAQQRLHEKAGRLVRPALKAAAQEEAGKLSAARRSCLAVVGSPILWELRTARGCRLFQSYVGATPSAADAILQAAREMVTNLQCLSLGSALVLTGMSDSETSEGLPYPSPSERQLQELNAALLQEIATLAEKRRTGAPPALTPAPNRGDGAALADDREAPSPRACAAPPPAEQAPLPLPAPCPDADNPVPEPVAAFPAPPPAGPSPPLPERNEHLYAIHYSQEKIENSTAQTPPVSAIVAQHVLTEEQHAFAAFRIAERRGTALLELPDQLPELEKEMLKDFFEFVAAHPQAVWLNWNMRGPVFGFEVLAQRARRHGLNPVEIPLERRFNLAAYLKRRFGDRFAPDPRLWHAIHQNGVNGPGLLDEAMAAAAWKRREYAALLLSLCCKVGAIVHLFDRVQRGIFQTCTPAPAVLPVPTSPEDTPARDPGASSRQEDAPSAEGRPLNDTERRILAYCRPKAHKGESIAHHVGLAYTGHIRGVLSRLVKEGRLRNTESGYRTVSRVTSRATVERRRAT